MRSIERRLEELEERGPREVPELTEEFFEEVFARHFPQGIKGPGIPMTGEQQVAINSILAEIH